jgi:hypothetical protein
MAAESAKRGMINQKGGSLSLWFFDFSRPPNFVGKITVGRGRIQRLISITLVLLRLRPEQERVPGEL